MVNRKKRLILLFSAIALLLFIVPFVSGQCVTPTDDLLINSNTVLCSGTYNIADSGSSGVIILNANNTVLTCNGTVLVGSEVGYGIYSSTHRNITIRNCTVSNYSVGIYVTASPYSTIERVNVTESTGNGIYLISSANSYLRNISTALNGGGLSNAGTYISGSNYVNITNLSSYRDFYEGLYFSSSSYCNATNLNITDLGLTSSWDGIYVSSSNYVIISNAYLRYKRNGMWVQSSSYLGLYNVLSWDHDYNGIVFRDSGFADIYNLTCWNADTGLYFAYMTSGVDSCLVRNSTFFNTGRGVEMGASCNNNMFYYNNFTSNSLNVVGGTNVNSFNTTVGGKPRGNYWSDIASKDIQIFDFDFDGFADGGNEYPYNSSNRASTSGAVTDWGPIVFDADHDVDPDWRDCDDNNASVFAPRDELLLNRSTTLCAGTYNLVDMGTRGVVSLNSSGYSLICNNTVMVGSGSGVGLSVYGDWYISGCNVRDYSVGLESHSTDNTWNWTYSLGATSEQILNVDTDSEDNVLLFGGWTSSYFRVFKLDNYGNEIWNKSYASTGYPRSMTVDKDDNIIFLGGSSGGFSMWKLWPNGTTQWTKTFAGYSSDSADLGTDSSGNIIVGYNPTSAMSVFTVDKMDSSGTYIWRKNYTFATSGNNIRALTIASNGDVVVAGFSNSANYAWRIGRISSAGSSLWNYSFDWSSSNEFPFDVEVDSSDNVYAVGMWYNSTAGLQAWRVLKLSGSGSELWNKSIMAPASDWLYAVDVDSSDNPVIAGAWTNTPYSKDWRISKLDKSTGASLWAHIYTWGTGSDTPNSVHVDSKGNIFPAGYYTSGKTNLAAMKLSDDGTFSSSISVDIFSSNFTLCVNGVSLNGSKSGTVLNSTFMNDSGCGISLNSTSDYVVRNSTFRYNSIGACTDGTSSQNLFYYNNFSNSTNAHAYAAASGNQWNTTLGGHAQGNFWDDVSLLDIFDSTGDKYGDVGTDYPYSSANGGNVSGYVTDYGPRVNLTCYDMDGDGFYNASSDASCPGAYRDCNDNNAGVFPPKRNMTLTSSVVLCNGTYHIPASGWSDAIKVQGSNLNIVCNNTKLVGNSTNLYDFNAGVGIYVDTVNNVTVRGCEVWNYTYGIYVGSGVNDTLLNNTARYNFHGLEVQGGMTNFVFNNTAYENDAGIYTYGPNYTVRYNKLFSNARGMQGGGGSVNANLTLTYNKFWNNSAYAIDSQPFSPAWYIANNEINDSGILLWQPGFHTVFGNRINVSTVGIQFISDSINNNVSFNNITSIYPSLYINVNNTNDTFEGNILDMLGSTGDDVVFAYNSSANTFKFNRITGRNFGNCISLYSTSSNSSFYNNTISGCRKGVFLESGTSNNVFYYNNFTNNSIAHADSQNPTNKFNTSVLGIAQGNFWGDVADLNIFDSDSDGWGDFGSQYPYNSTNGGKVSGFVTDWGPITTKSCSMYDADGDGAYNSTAPSDCVGYRDCNEYDASVLPPRDDLSVDRSMTLCSGTYYINDSGNAGILGISNASGRVYCNNTIMIGNSSGIGIYMPFASYIFGCHFENYSVGINTVPSQVGWSVSAHALGDDGWGGYGPDSFMSNGVDSSGNILFAYPDTATTANLSKLSGVDGSGIWDVSTGSGGVYSKNGTGISPAYILSAPVRDLVVASNDDVVVLRQLIGGGTSCYHQDFLFSRFNSSGGLLWTSVFTFNTAFCFGSGKQSAALGVDSAGYAVGAINFNNGTRHIGVIKVDSSGGAVWTSNFSANSSNTQYVDGVGFDSSDNVVFAGGADSSPTDWDSDTTNTVWFVGKLNGATGSVIWNKTFDWNSSQFTGNMSIGSFDDRAYAVAVDNATGDIFVAGTYQHGSNPLFAWKLLKLNSAGVEVWNRTYIWGNSSWNVNRPSDIALDSDGDVFVVGSKGAGLFDSGPVYPPREWAVAKYDGSTGDELWNLDTYYNGTADRVSVDSNDDIIVSGWSGISSGVGNVKLLRLSGSTGTIIQYDDEPNSGYVFNQTGVCGCSNGFLLRSSNNVTIFNSTMNNSAMCGLNVNSTNNLTVTNSTFTNNGIGVCIDQNSSQNLIYYNNFTDSTFAHASASASGNEFNTTVGGLAQGNYWSDISTSLIDIVDKNGDGFGDYGNEYPYSRANGGNVSNYVIDWGPITTKSCTTPKNDLFIRMPTTTCPGTYYINDSGLEGILRISNISGRISCNGTVIIGNDSGVGIYAGYDSGMSGCDVRNYSSSVKASGRYNGIKTFSFGNDDLATSVALDSNKNIIVAGSSSGNVWQIVKLDGRTMTQMWSRLINWPGSSERAYGVDVDSNDDVVVGGTFTSSQNDWKIAKLSGVDGSTIWSTDRVWTSGNDYLRDVAFDSQGNVIAVGTNYTTTTAWHVLKLDGSDGSEIWNKTFPALDSNAESVDTDSSDNIFVVGDTWSGWGYEFNILKLNGSTGAQLWNKMYRPPSYTSYWAGGRAVKIGSDAYVYAGGYWDSGTSSNVDAMMFKLDLNGNQVWNKTFIWSNAGDYVFSIDMDSSHALVIAGLENEVNRNWRVVKLNSSNGDGLWDRSFSWSSSVESAEGVAIGNDDDVTVAGYYTAGSYYDWLVLRMNSSGIADHEFVGVNITNMSVSDSANGVLLQYAGYDVLSNSSLSNNTACGLRLTSSNGYSVYDNTFRSNVVGVCIDNNSTRNLFFYNNFSGSASAHVNSASLGNQFNTTVLGKAQGNFWSDIFSLNIYDINNDKWGDSGSQYPYNRTNGANVTGFVTDFGPWTNKSCIDADGDDAFSTSSDVQCLGYRDCNDFNASILPPRDDLLIDRNMTLCSGTYYINDSGAPGVLKFVKSNVSLTCNGTVIIGNTSGFGVLDSYSNVSLKDCQLRNYSTAVSVGGLWNHTLDWFDFWEVDVDSLGVVAVGDTDASSTGGIVKFDSFGNLLWNLSVPLVTMRAVSIGPSDAVFVGGYNTSSNGACFAKYDSFGNKVWNVDSGYGDVYGVDTDSQGNLYGAGMVGSGQEDWGIAKLDSSGGIVWSIAVVWNATENEYATGVVVDNVGDIIFSGGYNVADTKRAALAKYSPAGTQIWNRTLEFWDGVMFVDVDVDSSNNIFVSASHYGGAIYYGAVAKYDSLGNKLWNKTFVLNDSDTMVWDVAVDSYGNAVVAVVFNGVSSDWALVKFDPSGNIFWNRTFAWSASGMFSQFALQGVAVDSDDNIFAAGFRDAPPGGWNASILKVSGAGDVMTADSIFVNDTFANSTKGVEISGDATSITFRNNTFFSNAYGLNISSDAINNIFYYNNFTNSTVAHAHAATVGNHFNTTVAGKAQGNYWDDILSLGIFDADFDGFGDYGSDYPYNATNGANVSGFVNDYGPIDSRAGGFWTSIRYPEGVYEPYNASLVSMNHQFTLNYTFVNISSGAGNTLECVIDLKNGSFKTISKVMSAVNQVNDSLTYTLSASDASAIRKTAVGHVPWETVNCSLYSVGDLVFTNASAYGSVLDKKIFVHNNSWSGFIDGGDVTSAAYCWLGTKNVWFNNSRQCDFEGDRAYAITLSRGNKIEGMCFDGKDNDLSGDWDCNSSNSGPGTDPTCTGLFYSCGLPETGKSYDQLHPLLSVLPYFNPTNPGVPPFMPFLWLFVSLLFAIGSVVIINSGTSTFRYVSALVPVLLFVCFILNAFVILTAGSISVEAAYTPSAPGNCDGNICSGTATIGGNAVTYYYTLHNRPGDRWKLRWDDGGVTSANTIIFSANSLHNSISSNGTYNDTASRVSRNSYAVPYYGMNLVGGKINYITSDPDGYNGIVDGVMWAVFNAGVNTSAVQYFELYAAHYGSDMIITSAAPVYFDIGAPTNDDESYTNATLDLASPCADSIDNDLDFNMDCHDLDCDGLPGNGAGAFCQYYGETNCYDRFDNDFDNDSNPSGYDLDYNTGMDCRDVGCNNSQGDPSVPANLCQYKNEYSGYPISCRDSFNNDADDGLGNLVDGVGAYSPTFYTDCYDADCWAKGGISTDLINSPCPSRENNTGSWCADSIDNDYDDGNNTRDTNTTSGVDCRDYDCRLTPFGSGAYNNGTSTYACQVNEYSGTDEGTPSYTPDASKCFDGIDNDIDNPFGKYTLPGQNIDCGDSDCAAVSNPSNSTLSCYGTEFNLGDNIQVCNDAFDNDGDLWLGWPGGQDCTDADCNAQFGNCGPCPSVENITYDSCADSIDTDYDGSTNCADADCSGELGNTTGSQRCGSENSNSACKDGFDNDADGLIDCKDPGCVGFTGPHGQTCQASESNCNDNFDNDADTYIDCFDTDCYANSACRISLVAAVSSFTVPAYDFNPPGSLFPGTSTLREYQLSHLYVDRNHTMTFTGSSSYSSSYTYIGSVSDLYIYNFSSCRIVGPSANNFTKIDSGDFGYIRNNASGTFSNFNFTLECETFTQPKAPDSFNVLASSAFSAGGKDEGSRDFSSTLHENTQPVVNAILVEPSAAGTVDIRYGGYVGIVANATDPGTGLYTSNISVCYFNIAGAGYTAQNDGLCRYKYQTYADASAITVQSYAIDGSNNTGSPYASGSFDINIMPILSDPLLLNKVKPFFKSAETIGLNVSFITASNGNFGSSVCAVTVIDSSGSVVSSSSLTPSAAGNTILCSGSITAPVGDDMYEVYVNVTDEDTDMAKSNEKAFYVCDSLSSSGAGWTCAKADFDQDGAAEGLFTTVNFRGLTMPCDNCPAEYNPEQYDFNANGVGELCEGPPRGSIVIYGNNGTEVTGSRNVFLNLSSVDMFGVEKCRFANDNESDLASAPWENCTTVKAWILSEGEGVKTVYYQMLNVISLTTTLNDSILYRFMQDFTAPTPPTVYDSTYGYDIDWWNSNTTLGAYWFNATEDLSNTIYYKYRIFENDSCYAGDCGWTDAGTSSDVNVTGLSLFEGYNYSFEVLAYTVSGLNSSGMSNGTFIDITMPGAPIINSTTHPSQDVTYGNNTVRFNFTAMDPLSNGVASGIEGYSYVLDSYPGTAPDDDMEDRQWSMMNRLRNSGASQLLREDETSSTPNTYAVFSQLKENFTENDSIRVRVALGEQPSDYDDPMGIKVYLMRVNDGVAISQFDGELDAITAVINTTRDVRYSYDLAGAAIYEFVLTVNTSVNDAVSDTYVVVSGVISDNDNRNNLSIAASILGFDNSTRNFVCNDSNSCTETTSVLDYAVEVAKEDSGDVWDVEYDSVDDGAFYFHVKAKDFAGNWGDPSHFKVNIETFGVSVELISPFTGQLFNTPNITAAVEVNKEANVSIIVVYQNGSGFNSSSVITNGTAEFNITLKEGINRVYAVAVNTKNGIVSYSDSAYVRFGLAVVHVDRTLRIMYPGTACSGHMCVLTEGGLVNIGIASENDSAVFGSNSINSDTGVHTLKIFATNPLMDSSGVEADLDDDEFLDRENPMFGFKKGTPYYIVRTEMRPSYAYLSGSRRMGAGNYVIVFRNVGTAPDGKTNISVVIR